MNTDIIISIIISVFSLGISVGISLNKIKSVDEKVDATDKRAKENYDALAQKQKEDYEMLRKSQQDNLKDQQSEFKEVNAKLDKILRQFYGITSVLKYKEQIGLVEED